MPNWEFRPLKPTDYAALMHLEEEVFGRSGEEVLGPYYVKLCCEFFGDSCLLALADGEAAGYVLSFVKGREAYCTTLAVAPQFQGSRLAIKLVRHFIAHLGRQVDSCWFTVKKDNTAARSLHAALGAKEVEVRRDFYRPGDDRIISRIDRPGLEALRGRLEKLGLLAPNDAALAGAA